MSLWRHSLSQCILLPTRLKTQVNFKVANFAIIVFERFGLKIIKKNFLSAAGFA